LQQLRNLIESTQNKMQNRKQTVVSRICQQNKEDKTDFHF